MSEDLRRTRADELRQQMGTSDRAYRITVTGTRRHTGKTTPLRTFVRGAAGGSWGVDLDGITDHLGDGDPAAVDKVLSAVLSQRHGRLASEGTVWRFGKVRVPVVVMNVILNALHSAGLRSVDIDDVKAIQSEYGSELKGLINLSTEKRQRAEQALYAVILKRCSSIG